MKPIDLTEELKAILRQMWRIDEKRQANETLAEAEMEYHKQHYPTIAEYYRYNSLYWQGRESVII